MMDQVREYLRQGKAEGWSERTVTAYRKALGYFVDFIRRKRHRKRFADVTAKDIDAYMQYEHDRGLKKATRMGRASILRAFFLRLTEEGKVLVNPARDIAVPDGGEPDLQIPPLEEHEVLEFFESLPRRNAIDLRNRCHLELLYGCALRRQEAVNLDLRDIDLNDRTLYVRGGKGGKGRVLPLMRGVIGALKDYLAVRRSLLRGPDHGALLLSRRGGRLNPATFNQWLSKFNKSRGPKAKRVHPHLLRHSIAVHLLRGGVDIRYIQQFLGHSLLNTTKIYLRLVPGRLKEDYDEAMPEIAVASDLKKIIAS